VSRVIVRLDVDEMIALLELARRERRNPRDQAALLIREGLRRACLLSTDTPQLITSAQVQAVTHDA
jgi:hypothetical protein